jgi:CBS domain-containing protein
MHRGWAEPERAATVGSTRRGAPIPHLPWQNNSRGKTRSRSVRTADERSRDAIYRRLMSAILTPFPLSTVDVGSVMSPGLVTCPPDAPLTEVAALMSNHQVHAVVVDPASPRFVTAGDIVRAALTGAGNVAEIVGGPPPSAAPYETVQAVCERMAAESATHVLVREGDDGVARGIISSFDIAAVVSGHDPRTARLVRPAPARPAISGGRLERHAVWEVMHRGVVVCPAQAPLVEIAGALVEHRTHTVMVAAATGWSFVTDMDVLSAAARGELTRTASQLASKDPHPLVGANETLDTAAALVASGPLGHIVVIDAVGRPAGVVSTLDIVGAIAASG